MKMTKKIFFLSSILFFIILILFLPLKLLVFCEQNYFSLFEKNNVYENMDMSEVKLILLNLLFFFNEEEELFYFSSDEKAHLEDVRILFKKLFLLLKVSIALLFVSLIGLYALSKNFQDEFFKALFLSGICSFVFLSLLFFASLNFSITFDGFHKLFFPQGNYLFSSESLLITLFPEKFFKDFFIRVLFGSLILSIISVLPQLFLNKLKK
ncbi:hypothetical protein CMO90_00705 [Candidatus Woesearchaeota archaeon]|jgi:uncharacterized membrane protein|nr:hypothetical protein [Candidatus Woesearchaeota archaeon]|tara:strand:- start:434 stop:1063 length:630 start_codon:yes stop_codon:yes gene_type:complete